MLQLDQLKTLKLDGMAEAFAELEMQGGTADLTHAEWLGLLIDRENASRDKKRFESRMRTVRLRQRAGHTTASAEKARATAKKKEALIQSAG